MNNEDKNRLAAAYSLVILIPQYLTFKFISITSIFVVEIAYYFLKKKYQI